MKTIFDDGNVRIRVREGADIGEIGAGMQRGGIEVMKYYYDRATAEERASLRALLDSPTNAMTIGGGVVADMKEALRPVRLVPRKPA